MKGKIIKDLNNGNPTGNGYTIKEILTEHVRLQHDFEVRLLDKLDEKQTSEGCQIQSGLIRQSLNKYTGFLFILISALAGYVFYG